MHQPQLISDSSSNKNVIKKKKLISQDFAIFSSCTGNFEIDMKWSQRASRKCKSLRYIWRWLNSENYKIVCFVRQTATTRWKWLKWNQAKLKHATYHVRTYVDCWFRYQFCKYIHQPTRQLCIFQIRKLFTILFHFFTRHGKHSRSYDFHIYATSWSDSALASKSIVKHTSCHHMSVGYWYTFHAMHTNISLS